MSLNEIRQQLKMIRLYYTNKARFSAAFESLPHNVTQLANRYAAMVNSAPQDGQRTFRQQRQCRYFRHSEFSQNSAPVGFDERIHGG